MTFIASVVAKKGVAVIADSLSTSMRRVIEYDKFIDFIREKSKETPLEEIKIEPGDLVSLFDKKPSHTKDYEEKLFEYDKYTSVTTAGAASINEKRIEYLIKDIVASNKKNRASYTRKKFETKIKDFCNYLDKEIVEHLKKYEEVFHTTFIFSHYDHIKETTEIYKVDVLPASTSEPKEESKFSSYRKMSEFYKVVCDGQNRISERILFGEADFLLDITPKIIRKVIKDLGITKEQVPKDYIKDFLNKAKPLLPKQFFDDMKVNKLAGLSLQQAVDLASLLMKIEINFQKYTENIPTVGGVIKLAVIDKDGFKFISGNDILKPDNIN